MIEKIKKIARMLKKDLDFTPDIAIVLGSGLSDFVSCIEIIKEISYSEIDFMPTSTVDGHSGKFVFGTCEGKKLVVMQGRVHLYEGYPISQVILPIRIMRFLGAKKLILTNAAGGISFAPSDLMAITDHIMNVPNPLIGINEIEIGTRFPDMSEIYDKKLTDKLLKTAASLEIDIKQGVYMQFSGPSFETPAEIRMAKILGADAIGMSTACEAVAAKHCDFKVVGISLITNFAAGISKMTLSHAEVIDCGRQCREKFEKLLREYLKVI